MKYYGTVAALGSILESDLIKFHMLIILALYTRVICGVEKEYRNQLERKNGIK